MDLAGHHNVVSALNLLIAADGRFPAGGYAHSAGLEQAAERGRIDNETDLHGFLRGHLATIGRTNACFAAAACHVWRSTDPADPLAVFERDTALVRLTDEESTRIPSAELRAVSRAMARSFLRAAGDSWPQLAIPRASIVPGGAHLSAGQGIVAAELGLDPRGAALLGAYANVTGPAAAAVKLLGLDPFAVNRVVTALSDLIAEMVDEAGDLADCDARELPCGSAPLIEIGAELHARRQPRMFAS